MNMNFKVMVGLKNRLGVIDMSAGIEDGQCTLAKEGVGAAGAGCTELLYFTLRERFQAALRADGRVDDLLCWHAVFLNRELAIPAARSG